MFRERGDILFLTVDADGRPDKAYDFLVTEHFERALVLSPDGRWIAYVSDLSGQDEIYVEPFPGREQGRVQVSNEGGRQPLWGPHGRELFYRSGNGMVAVAVKTEPRFEIVSREILFERISWPGSIFRTQYDIHPDGQRFLMIEDQGIGESPRQINVTLDWFEEVRELAPR